WRTHDRPREVAAGDARVHPAHVVIGGPAELVDDVGLQDPLEDEAAERLGVWTDRTGTDARQPLDASGVHSGDDVRGAVRVDGDRGPGKGTAGGGGTGVVPSDGRASAGPVVSL